MGAAPHSSAHFDRRGTVTLTIQSRLEELAAVHEVLSTLALKHEIDEEATTAILIAVIEAGTNAIQHGNVFADDKRVTFDFKVASGEFVAWVDDYGKGFNPDKVGNPTDPSALLSPHGRGLYLMRSLMDEVRFHTRQDHGTTVFLKKHLGTGA